MYISHTDIFTDNNIYSKSYFQGIMTREGLFQHRNKPTLQMIDNSRDLDCMTSSHEQAQNPLMMCSNMESKSTGNRSRWTDLVGDTITPKVGYMFFVRLSQYMLIIIFWGIIFQHHHSGTNLSVGLTENNLTVYF